MNFFNKTFLIAKTIPDKSAISIIKLKTKKIIVFSRDELKQFEMRYEIKSNNIEYHIGDVRDKTSLKFSMQNVDYIFFAAALKQVPSCEFYPDEAVKTNFLGALNVIELADQFKIKKIIFLSTDKAVEPINSMGMSKSLMEKLASSKSLNSKTKFIITRYGNVLASRGSVLPTFVNLIQKKEQAHVTSEDMTRFMMKMDEAIDLVLFALIKGRTGSIYVKKCPASQITTLAKAVGVILNKKVHITYTGIRAGEKIHETLISKFEMLRTNHYKAYFEIIPEINYNYNQFTTNGVSKKLLQDYNSSNNLLDQKSLIKLIKPTVLKLVSKLH